jgi:hypothetical protein
MHAPQFEHLQEPQCPFPTLDTPWQDYWEVNAEEINLLAKSEEARRASEEARRASEEARRAKEAQQLAEAHIADLQRQLQLLQSRASAPGPTQQPSGGSPPPPAAPLDAMSADERHNAVADGAGGAGAAAAPPEVTSLAPLTGAAAATAADAEKVLVRREHPAGADAATPATARGRFATPATTSSGGRSIGPPHGEQPASEVQSTPQLTRQAAEPAAGPTLEPSTKLESEPAAAVAETPACIGDAVPFPQRQQQQQQQQQGQQAEEPPPAVAHALLELKGAQAALEEAQRAQQEAQCQLGQRAVEEATSQLALQEAEVAAAAADTALAEARATLQRRREGREAAARAEAAQLQGELKEKAQAFDDSFWDDVPVSCVRAAVITPHVPTPSTPVRCLGRAAPCIAQSKPCNSALAVSPLQGRHRCLLPSGGARSRRRSGGACRPACTRGRGARRAAAAGAAGCSAGGGPASGCRAGWAGRRRGFGGGGRGGGWAAAEPAGAGHRAPAAEPAAEDGASRRHMHAQRWRHHAANRGSASALPATQIALSSLSLWLLEQFCPCLFPRSCAAGLCGRGGRYGDAAGAAGTGEPLARVLHRTRQLKGTAPACLFVWIVACLLLHAWLLQPSLFGSGEAMHCCELSLPACRMRGVFADVDACAPCSAAVPWRGGPLRPAA